MYVGTQSNPSTTAGLWTPFVLNPPFQTLYSNGSVFGKREGLALGMISGILILLELVRYCVWAGVLCWHWGGGTKRTLLTHNKEFATKKIILRVGAGGFYVLGKLSKHGVIYYPRCITPPCIVTHYKEKKHCIDYLRGKLVLYQA